MTKKMLNELAYEALKDKVLGMNSGDYLSIRKCASAFGMSYTPVREAFIRLEREGVFYQIPNVGYFVKNVTSSDLLQIYQVRECVELFAMNKAFDAISKEDLSRMRELAREVSAARKANQTSKSVDLDIALHRIPLERYGNDYLLTLYDELRGRYKMQISKRISALEAQSLLEDTAHEELLDAIQAGNKQDAMEKLKDHIDMAIRNLFTKYVKCSEKPKP